MDHYSTLGVSRDASPEEIKKAYRRLASKHHPDRPGGNADEFKKVQAAYEAITNPDPINDIWGRASSPWEGDINDIYFNFDDILSQTYKNRQQQRNPPITVPAEITLEQAYNGADITINVGFAKEIIHIEPGTTTGTKYRIHGKGSQRFKNAPPGDIIVKVYVIEPADIVLDKADIISKIDISVIDALVGATVTVSHVSGKQVNIKVPAGTQQGSKLRLSGYGMPYLHSTSQKGNWYVILNLVTPRITNEEHINYLKKIQSEVK